MRSRFLPLVAAALAVLSLAARVPTAQAASKQIGGGDPVAKAIAWSQANYSVFHKPFDVILVRADNFADALAAGALAGALDAPVLVTPGDHLDDRVAAEIDRIEAPEVRIIGGTAAVSQAVEDALRARGKNVIRHAGGTRVGTAVDVASNSGVYSGAPNFVFLARAFSDGDPTRAFADSLGAGMVAGAYRQPLLVTASDSLSDEVRSYLQSHPVDTVYIVGGVGAVSDNVAQQVAALVQEVDRISGSDRFETAALLAPRGAAEGPDKIVALVEGLHADSWISGFAAAAFGAGGAVLLANGDTLPASTKAYLQSSPAATLLCAPEVSAAACQAADDALAG
jgi:putative cell wall-binding protein